MTAAIDWVQRNWIDANLALGFVERFCPDHGRTSAELDLAEVTETGESVDYCHAGEHFVQRGTWKAGK